MSKSKFFSALLVVLILALGVYVWRHASLTSVKSLKDSAAPQDGEQVADNPAENMDDISEGINPEDIDYNAICENGDWLNVASVSGETFSASGKLRRVDPEDEKTAQFKNYLYYLEGTPSYALTGTDLSQLDPFESRTVEIQGVKNSEGKEIAVSQIKCSGSETDKNMISSRTKFLDFIAQNISAVAPHKAKYQNWTVDTVDFVDNNNVYAEYYDTVENDENSSIEDDTSRQILLEISPQGDASFSTKLLAYFEMGDEDYVLKEGSDKFADVREEDKMIYQYDQDRKTWERIN